MDSLLNWVRRAVHPAYKAEAELIHESQDIIGRCIRQLDALHQEKQLLLQPFDSVEALRLSQEAFFANPVVGELFDHFEVLDESFITACQEKLQGQFEALRRHLRQLDTEGHADSELRRDVARRIGQVQKVEAQLAACQAREAALEEAELIVEQEEELNRQLELWQQIHVAARKRHVAGVARGIARAVRLLEEHERRLCSEQDRTQRHILSIVHNRERLCSLQTLYNLADDACVEPMKDGRVARWEQCRQGLAEYVGDDKVELSASVQALVELQQTFGLLEDLVPRLQECLRQVKQSGTQALAQLNQAPGEPEKGLAKLQETIGSVATFGRYLAAMESERELAQGVLKTLHQLCESRGDAL
jgi:hypothetical protein